MHNVISSGFFPSEELCWAEGGLVLGMFWAGKGVICRWQWGVGTERLVCFHVLFFSYFSPSVPVSYFFDFVLMLSIYFADCVAVV